MSSIESWFFNDLSLKHLASVKTVQLLWRHLKVGNEIKPILNQFSPERNSQGLIKEMNTQKSRIARKIECFIDELLLPKPIKDDLSLFVWEMYEKALSWLEDSLILLHSTTADPNVSEKMGYFVDNIIWDSIGCIDGKKIIESYVSTKETCDYHTWALLCHYCCEDLIRQFSGTIDWTKSRFNSSSIPIYWYHKIHGIFPSEDMFTSPSYFIEFKNRRAAGVYDENQINIDLFRGGLENLPRFKYFMDQFTDAEKLEFFGNFFLSPDCCDEITIYLFSRISSNILIKSNPQNAPWWSFVKWPWVLFIDSWIDKFPKEHKCEYFSFFSFLSFMARLDKSIDGTEEFTRKQIRGHRHAKYYAPFEKFWTLYNETFGPTNDPTLLEIIGKIFESRDMVLCEIVMKESTSAWREIYLDGIRKFCNDRAHEMPDQDFCDEFKEVILMSDEERKIFQEMVDRTLKHDRMKKK